jgi:hypothetical protein
VVCIVATDVEPQVTGEGKDALHGLSVEFGRVGAGSRLRHWFPALAWPFQGLEH